MLLNEVSSYAPHDQQHEEIRIKIKYPDGGIGSVLISQNAVL